MKPSPAQEEQRVLAWLKHQVMGARENLYCRGKVPPGIQHELQHLRDRLHAAEKYIDYYLKTIKERHETQPKNRK